MSRPVIGISYPRGMLISRERDTMKLAFRNSPYGTARSEGAMTPGQVKEVGGEKA